MVFNDSTNNSGICQEIDALCDSTSTSYPLKDKTRRVNAALEQVIGWLINADGTAQFDDTNYGNLPIGTYTMVEGQSAYSFNDKFLQLMEVQIKNADGIWEIIEPIDQKEYSDVSPLYEDFKTADRPIYYDKISDDTIKLYPPPTATSVTLTSGLKICFKRTASLFAADGSDTTAGPGFASPYHIILPYMAALPYCMTYKKDRVSLYELKIKQLKDELINHYSQREKDKRKIMTFTQTPYL